MRKLLIFKLGNESRPATDEDIDNLKLDLEEAFKDRSTLLCLVSHHALQVESFDIPDSFTYKVETLDTKEAVELPEGDPNYCGEYKTR